MKRTNLLPVLCAALLFAACNQTSDKIDLSKIDPGLKDTAWYHNPLRFIQTNLNEPDAKMDVDLYIKTVADVSANLIVFNIGGQTANYPTKLKYHFTNPYLKGDLTDEVLRKFHAQGIKVIGRFDLSKIDESFAFEKPEWLYKGTNGKFVNENGKVHTCINGGYQQEYAFEILKEVITNYPLDAIFFNWGGYQTRDYSQVVHGICQCESCKKRFRDSTGLTLPVVPDINDQTYRKYRDFQKSTTAELNNRILAFTKSLRPDLILQTHEGELYRSEAGTGFTSATDWNYHATENVKKVLGSYKDKMSTDTYNYLMGMDYRFTATSPNIGKIFLAEHMLNGAGPGIYFMGRMENQYDRVFLPTLKDMFEFHKRNEKIFTNVESVSRVGLVIGASADYRGIIKMLTEEHIMYDLIQQSSLGSEEAPHDLKYYDALILSNVTDMDDNYISMIDNYVKNGGKILATGFPGINDNIGTPLDKIRLQSLGIMPEYELFPQTQATYLKVSDSDKTDLGKDEFIDFDLIMMNSGFMKCRPTGDATGYLKLLPNTVNGPPERVFFSDDEITDFPGIVFNSFGSGKAVLIPWQIGSQYSWKGNNGQRAVFMASLMNLLKLDNPLETDASPLIEMTRLTNRIGAFEWVGMINHSGQLGDAFREPVAIHNTTIRFKPLKPVKSIYLMRSEKGLKFRQNDGWIECIVPQLDDFEMILCMYD